MRLPLSAAAPRLLLAPIILFFGIGLSACTGESEAETSAEEPQFEVLVFSKTEGFRHDSIEDGIEAVQELGEEHDFAVTATEDASHFTGEELSRYAAIVFLSTSEDVFNEEEQAGFQRYIQEGGGFVGVHAASTTEYDWPWFGRLVGGYFDGHPSVQEASVEVVDGEHRSTRMLPDPWVRTDEWYHFRDLNEDVDVLLNLDEASYDLEDMEPMGEEHPLAWYHEYDGGRAWYTALGHTSASYEEPLFLEHLLGGIRWAAGEEAPEAAAQ